MPYRLQILPVNLPCSPHRQRLSQGGRGGWLQLAETGVGPNGVTLASK
jgi:hypothetical protein